MKSSINLILCLFLFYSCHQEKLPLFNGEIEIVDINVPLDTISGQEIFLDGIYTGYMTAYDSLLVFLPSSANDFMVRIFSSNTKEELGQFFRLGEGPDEFYDFTHTEQFFTQENQIKLWGFDGRKNIYLFNITKSIKEQKTIVDTIITYDWMKYHTKSWGYSFMLDDGQCLIKCVPEYNYLNKKEISLGGYYLFKDSFENELAFYQLFNRPINADQSLTDIEMTYDTRDRVNLKQRKLAMSMYDLGQLNILDLDSKKLKGFRLNTSVDFEDLKKNVDYRMYYKSITTTDDFIFLLYSNQIYTGDVPYSEFNSDNNEIHVFTWDGKLVKRLIMEHNARHIAVDPIHNRLYTIDRLDQVYCHELKSINFIQE